MNISEEKEYIYKMMHNMLAERRKLTDLSLELKKRLDVLIELETKGMEEISVKDLVGAYNSRETQRMVENIQKVTDSAVERVREEAEDRIHPPKKEIIPKRDIELEKEKVSKSSVRRGGMTTDKAAGMIAHVLKEHGVPMTVADLYEKVNEMSDVPITRANFRNNLLPRSRRVNKNIDNVSRGYYQYLRK